ncbi:MAG: hypothetical protein QN130_12475 [Armatimonadota bacterium]|nr:hypothetical protein [Armatimonadota bacterium]
MDDYGNITGPTGERYNAGSVEAVRILDYGSPEPPRIDQPVFTTPQWVQGRESTEWQGPSPMDVAFTEALQRSGVDVPEGQYATVPAVLSYGGGTATSWVPNAQGVPVQVPDWRQMDALTWSGAMGEFLAQTPGVWLYGGQSWVPTGMIQPEARPTTAEEYLRGWSAPQPYARDLNEILYGGPKGYQGVQDPFQRMALEAAYLQALGVPLLPQWTQLAERARLALPPEQAAAVAAKLREAVEKRRRAKQAAGLAAVGSFVLGGLGAGFLGPALAASLGPTLGGATAGALGATVPQLIASGVTGDWDWRRIVGATVGGAVGGGAVPALTSAGVPSWVAAGVGPATGGLAQWGITGRPPSWIRLGTSAATGAGAALMR